MGNTHKFIEGDVVYSIGTDGMYNLSKILKIDTSDDREVWHQLFYSPVKELPEISHISDLPVFIYHVPMVRPDEVPIYVSNLPVTEDDLEGYNEYLKQTQA